MRESTEQTQPLRFPRPSGSWRHYLPVFWVVIIGMAFSAAVFAVVRWWEYQEIAREFQLAAEDRAYAVIGTFETETAMLDLVRSALEDDEVISRVEFRRLVAPFLSRSRSIGAVEWVPRVAHADRAMLSAEARREGFADYQITEIGEGGRMIPARRRDEYFPVLFIGPRPGDKNVYGFDVASEPIRREALQMACDSGWTVASGRIDFVQDGGKWSGFLVVLPVYERGKTTLSIPERRANLRGFVLGVFRPDDMLTASLSKIQPAGIDVCLFDPSAAEDGRPFPFHASRQGNRVWEPTSAADLNDPKRLHFVAKLGTSGSPWTVVCLATRDFVAARRTWWPWAVLAAGLTLTGLLAAYIKSSIERKTFVDRLLAEKRLHAEQLCEKVRRQTADIRRVQEEVIFRLLSATQCRDEETGAHVRRVGLISEVLARAVGWSDADAECIRQAAPMHDVGKIGIPDAILRKPGKLSAEEYEVMKTHTLLGADMLADSSVPMLQMAREIALSHHERWDGRGYPHGLSGQEIPEAARIVAIADVYDALTHDRIYQAARSEEEALAIMRGEAGTQFDPLLLAHFFLNLPAIRRIAEEHPDAEPKAAPFAPVAADAVAASPTLVGS